LKRPLRTPDSTLTATFCSRISYTSLFEVASYSHNMTHWVDSAEFKDENLMQLASPAKSDEHKAEIPVIDLVDDEAETFTAATRPKTSSKCKRSSDLDEDFEPKTPLKSAKKSQVQAPKTPGTSRTATAKTSTAPKTPKTPGVTQRRKE
jgi:hypothetical protein